MSGEEAVDEDAAIPSRQHTMLREHQVLTGSQGQSEGECKVKAKEETDAKITSNKRDKSGLEHIACPKWGCLALTLLARKLK